MNLKTIIWALLVVQLLFLSIGCDREDAASGNPVSPSSDSAIIFSSQTSSSFSTKASLAPSWDHQDVILEDNPTKSVSSQTTKGISVEGTEPPVGSFGVSGYLLTDGVWSNTTSLPTFQYNTQVTRLGTTSNYTLNYFPQRYWPDKTTDLVRFFAYYPYNGNGIVLSASTVAGFPSIQYTPSATIADQVDLMYASAAAVNNKLTGSPVSLAFKHALTRIGFSVRLGTSTLQKVTVQSIVLSGLKDGGTLSLDPSQSNPWTTSTQTTSYNLSVSNGALISEDFQTFSNSNYLPITSANGYLFLLPQSVTSANTVTVAYTVDDLSYTALFQLDNATWSMGQSINYQLTLLIPSNCYILAPGSTLSIPVNIKGNGNSSGLAGETIQLTHSTSSVSILWQTSNNLVSIGALNTTTGRVSVTAASGVSGNALLVAKNSSGTILWSWHLWITNYDPYTSDAGVQVYNNLTWMNRNLGAFTAYPNTTDNVQTRGLHYQWGRKDPFPGSTSTSNGNQSDPTLYGEVTSIGYTLVPTTGTNVQNTIAAPITFYRANTGTNNYDWYSGTSGLHNNALWGNATTTIIKTIFDPCPAGWRVPPYISGASPWAGWTTSNTTWVLSGNALALGRTYQADIYYPAAGCRHYTNLSTNLNDVQAKGNYWSASPNGTSSYYLYFYNSSISSSVTASRGFGYSVRCVQE